MAMILLRYKRWRGIYVFPKTCMNQHWLYKLCKLSSIMQESFTPSRTMNGWRLSIWYLKRLESCWKRYRMMLIRMQRFTKKRLRVFMTEWLQEKSFMLETKSFFIIRVWNFFLASYALIELDPLLFLMFFLVVQLKLQF
jgi:hypothetical protein